MEKYYINLVKKFHSKVDRTAGVDKCWPWKDLKNIHGYGMFPEAKLNNIDQAHRFAYLIGHKQSPKGFNVKHTCDKRDCCNPKHLYLAERRPYWRLFHSALREQKKSLDNF